ncbi:MAG: site-specific DNA-methyltransferase [Mesorhizobium sp.]
MRNTLQIEQVAISDIKPSPFAVRRHERNKRRNLETNIKRHGIVVPLLVDGQGLIVDGHARYQAAVELGLTHVPVISLAHMTSDEILAFRIAVNRLPQLATWDKRALQRDFQHLLDVGFDLDLTAYGTVEIENCLQINTSTPGEVEEIDAAMLPATPVARSGDIYVLGSGAATHRLACGDCRNESLRQSLFDGHRAQLCFTDSPYNVRIPGFVSGLGQSSHRDFSMASGEMTGDQFTQFLTETMMLTFSHLDIGAVGFFCMDWRHIRHLVQAGEDQNLELLNIAVWVKSNAGMGSYLRSQHELIAIFKRAGEKHRNNVELGKHGRSRSNVWQYRGVNVMGPERHLLKEHPTVKPSAMIAVQSRKRTSDSSREICSMGTTRWETSRESCS